MAEYAFFKRIQLLTTDWLPKVLRLKHSRILPIKSGGTGSLPCL